MVTIFKSPKKINKLFGCLLMVKGWYYFLLYLENGGENGNTT